MKMSKCVVNCAFSKVKTYKDAEEDDRQKSASREKHGIEQEERERLVSREFRLFACMK